MDIKDRNIIPAYVNIVCDKCKKIHRVSKNWEPYIAKCNKSEIIDPAFGLLLWYKDAVKGNTIWAYNLRHLTAIDKTSYSNRKLCSGYFSLAVN